MKKIIPMVMMATLPTVGMAQDGSGLFEKNFDRSVKPQDDFYQFATGGWQKNNPLPAAYSRFGSFQDTCTDGADVPTIGLSTINDGTGISIDTHRFGVHFVLGKVFHFNVVKVAQAAMQGDVSSVNAFYLHHLHKMFGEVEVCSRCSNRPFMLCKHRLEVLQVVSVGVRKILVCTFRTVVYDVAG